MTKNRPPGGVSVAVAARRRKALWRAIRTLLAAGLASLVGSAWAQGAVTTEGAVAREIRRVAFDLESAADLDPLLERVGNAQVVLLGEASHGTSEYYTWRARITRRLVEEKGFSFVAVEGDWPDAYRVNRYVKGETPIGRNAYEVLHAFARWPTWMWANWEVVAFTEWLEGHNAGLPEGHEVGFYGLDVYSLWESLGVILTYLEENRDTLQGTEAQGAARAAQRCFEPSKEDEGAYARSTLGASASCEAEVVALLTEIRRLEVEDPEARFNLLQNAFAVVNAERYYRAMVRDGALSWNVRDVHMADALGRLLRHHGPDAKAVVWEHNTHVGDARATSMAAQGMVNLGQLARERYGRANTVLVGFGSHHGTVVAAAAWDAPMREMTVPPAEVGSWEDLFADAGEENKLLIMDRLENLEPLSTPRGHRAIGVVYDPLLERFGNYVPTVLPERYDAFIYLHETRALHPLHVEPRSRRPPELYPWGF